MLSSNMYLYCQNNPVCCVDPTGSLGSFFDFPLSMADRMQMSQSMLDNYNAAKAAVSATSPSPPSISQETGSGKNGGIIKWEIPGTKTPIFEWNEDVAKGAHYHAFLVNWQGKHLGPYDTKNRLESYLNKVEGETVKTKFVYGNPAEDPQQSPAQLYGIQINDRDVISYTYDHLSCLDSRILNTLNPFVTSYEYLPGGENESTTLLVGSMQNGDTRLSYTYDAVGNIETISENGELKAKYYYDELSQLIREDNKELNQTIVYQYDQGGNILSKPRYA